MKEAGILLPVFSLPSKEGVGTFGKDTFAFLDMVKACGFHYWQVLPLNPLDCSYSPYATISSFAGETIYIDLNELVELGLLDSFEEVKDAGRVAYREIKSKKEIYFKEAFQRFDKNCKVYDAFMTFKETTPWLHDFCRFKVLYHLNDKQDWPTWEENEVREEDMDFEAFKQFFFFRQWGRIKDYAHQLGIQIIGDLPFYIGFNSEDVYDHRHLFKLDESNQPSCVSGVPPDYFNPEGQRWNHPIYNWDNIEAEGFDYWIDKVVQACHLFDILRLDHFRAFDTFWQVDVHSVGAKEGEWIEAPGKAFFETLFSKHPDLNIIVEDLGYLREEVYALKDMFDLSGMKIMQFAFEETMAGEIPEKCIFYTGTHDNNTLKSWQQQENIPYSIEELLEIALNTNANIVIFPMQDLLGLDDAYRINEPGTEGEHNWTVRFENLEAFKNKIEEIKGMLENVNRI